MLDPAPKVSHETELEEGVHAYLSTVFCKDSSTPFRGQDFVVANTARGGERKGRWTRPDLTLVTLQRLHFQQRIDLELFGFELKRDGQADISSVFEAVAHTRFVHYAYVVWQVLPGSDVSRVAKDIEANCQVNGIGLITFADPLNRSTYRTILTPARKNPHPYDVDDYLSSRLPAPDREILSEKLQRLRGAF